MSCMSLRVLLWRVVCGLVWFGVCSYMASAEGYTLDLPHSSAARRINNN
jgi:hypothetical protein